MSGGITRRSTSTSTNTDVHRGIVEFTGWEEDISPGHTEDTYVDNSTTLLAEVVDATRAEAVARGQSAHQIWLPPLPPAIELSAVAADFHPHRDARSRDSHPRTHWHY